MIGTTVVFQPLITEKSMSQAQGGWYSFKVHVDADKNSIARDIGLLYNVEVIVVRTMKRTGKMHRSGKKMILSQKSHWKKAVVQLKKGQRIPIFEVTDTQGAK